MLALPVNQLPGGERNPLPENQLPIPVPRPRPNEPAPLEVTVARSEEHREEPEPVPPRAEEKPQPPSISLPQTAPEVRRDAKHPTPIGRVFSNFEVSSSPEIHIAEVPPTKEQTPPASMLGTESARAVIESKPVFGRDAVWEGEALAEPKPVAGQEPHPPKLNRSPLKGWGPSYEEEMAPVVKREVAKPVEPVILEKPSPFLERHAARLQEQRRTAPWLAPLGWINSLFDRCVLALGRPGILLVRAESRDLLGWIGIGLLVAALAILVGDWFGWTW
jgi:hypothetical protein